ncbi:MAG TPA: UbiX family flavin prenyltransferase [Pirellulaceae bacterium]|nr:UbiX family flavin prenyltransferase [Pirellulaceae bacterium]
MTPPVIVAITGASGAIYGQRLVEILLTLRVPVHLSISESARHVFQHELGLDLRLEDFAIEQLLPRWETPSAALHYSHFRDMLAPMASGSFQTSGMVVCPCSGSTMSGIATAASGNLIQRAADVHLKERRRLIVVPRETPLSLTQLKNWLAVTRAGGIVLPASPGFYHGADRVSQLVDFIVARILDLMGIPHQLTRRWGEAE